MIEPLKNLFRAVSNITVSVLSFPIRLYRKYISPLKLPCCRFTPSCSQYALQALSEWGVFRGSALALWRILRCNPFGGCGEDPVPKRKARPCGSYKTFDPLKDRKNERD